MVGFQIDEITACTARVYRLVAEHIADPIILPPFIPIHHIDLIPDVQVMEQAPPEVVMCDQTNIAVACSELEIRGCV